ncbi:MAG: hypothetical protein AAFX01_07315 [Cyanobacteria bacterium J06638_28]
MVMLRYWSTLVLGTSLALVGLPARAEAPGIYYSWRSINGDVVQCIDRSTAVLNEQQLENIQVEGSSVAGMTATARAVFVCLDSNDTTTVMIMVSSVDDTVAFELREALKTGF